MKLCIISDLHGSELWKTILEREKQTTEYFVFLGDYFDSKSLYIKADNELKNLQELVNLQLSGNYKIKLLVGNHDLQYLGGSRTSAYNQETAQLTQKYLKELIQNGILQATVCFDNYLLSHAGISSEWMQDHQLNNWQEINQLMQEKPKEFSFVKKNSWNDPKGNDTFQGPLWIRPQALLQSAIPDYHQVVGHTRVTEIYRKSQKNLNYFFTDTTMQQYLLLDTESSIYQIKTCQDK